MHGRKARRACFLDADCKLMRAPISLSGLRRSFMRLALRVLTLLIGTHFSRGVATATSLLALMFAGSALAGVAVPGVVIDDSGAGVAQATVQIVETGAWAGTDAQGNFRLADIEPGHY